MGSTNRKRIEAALRGKAAKIADARYLHGTVCCRSDGHHRTVARITLGGLLTCHRLPMSKGVGMGEQQSAEAVVVAWHRCCEGPNLEGVDSHACSLIGPDRNSGVPGLTARWPRRNHGSRAREGLLAHGRHDERNAAHRSAPGCGHPGNAGYVIRTSGVVGGRRA